MNEKPDAFWAVLMIYGAIVLAVAALIVPIHEKDVTLAALGFCTSIATGAFGYIQGKRDGIKDASTSTPQPKE